MSVFTKNEVNDLEFVNSTYQHCILDTDIVKVLLLARKRNLFRLA